MADPKTLVQDYLARMEARDLSGAKSLIHQEFEMEFPGPVRFRTFEELIDWAKPRYNWVKKRIEQVDAGPAEDGTAVSVFGTLYGEWPDGSQFEGIRFIDWFLVRDDLILRQKVWNDIAEVRSAR